MGFRFKVNERKKIKRAYFELIIRNARAYTREATELLKDSITELLAVDTGELRNSADVDFLIDGGKNSITFKASTSAEHGIYVLLGLGSNRKKGSRDYLAKWVNKMYGLLGIKKTFQSKVVQPPAYKDIKKDYKIKSWTRKGAISLQPGKGFKRVGVKRNKSGTYSSKFTRI